MTKAFPIQIRNVRNDDYEAICQLQGFTIAHCIRSWQSSGIGADPVTRLCWMHRANDTVGKGPATVLIMEKIGLGEIIGVIRCQKIDRANPPINPQYSDVCKEGTSMKQSIARYKWLSGLLEKYGKFICACFFSTIFDLHAGGLHTCSHPRVRHRA